MPAVILQQLVPPDLHPGQVVRLEDHTMPDVGPVEAREQRLARLVYPGGVDVEVQQLGLSDEALELRGHLRDSWSTPGFALAARAALYQLQAAGHPIWLSYGQLWGRMVTLQRLEFAHDEAGMTYRLVLEHTDLAEDASGLLVYDDPQAPLLALDQVSAEADAVAAVTLPEGL